MSLLQKLTINTHFKYLSSIRLIIQAWTVTGRFCLQQLLLYPQGIKLITQSITVNTGGMLQASFACNNFTVQKSSLQKDSNGLQLIKTYYLVSW